LIGLLIGGCGTQEIEDTQIEDLQQVEVGAKVDTDLEPDVRVEEEEEVPDLYNPGVEEIVGDSKSITKWHYEFDGKYEVVLVNNKMRRAYPGQRSPNHAFLDIDTKEAKGYFCEGRPLKCREPVDLDYEKLYLKTPLDWLNEEDFFDGVFYESKRRNIANRPAYSIVVTRDNIRKTYWFDINENILLGVEVFDTVGRKIIEEDLYELVSLPKNIYASDTEPLLY
jgi:hypothetical protein